MHNIDNVTIIIDGNGNAAMAAALVAAINGAIPSAKINAANGVLGLDANGTASGALILLDGASETLTAAQYASREIDIRSHGAKCDGVTDDTTAVNSVIDYLCTLGGGTVIFPRGTKTLMLGALLIPYTMQPYNGTTAPFQPPILLMGGGSIANGYWTGINNGGTPGSVLDIRYDGSDGLHTAKIDTRGAGVLGIENLTLSSGGTDNFQMVRTTNTTFLIDRVTFSGNPANVGTSCVQNAIQLGTKLGTAPLSTADAEAGFQGYGTRISNCYFSNIQIAVGFGYAANSVQCENLTISLNCGSALYAPYVFYGNGSYANRISGGICEIGNYPYAGYFFNGTGPTIGNIFDGVGLWDEKIGAPTVGGFYFGGNNVQDNIISKPYSSAALRALMMKGPGATLNTFDMPGPAQMMGAPVFPLVGGTAYQWTGSGLLSISIEGTFDPSAAAAFLEIDIGPDGSTWTIADYLFLPAGMPNGYVAFLKAIVPPNWYYRVNASSANVTQTNGYWLSLP